MWTSWFGPSRRVPFGYPPTLGGTNGTYPTVRNAWPTPAAAAVPASPRPMFGRWRIRPMSRSPPGSACTRPTSFSTGVRTLACNAFAAVNDGSAVIASTTGMICQLFVVKTFPRRAAVPSSGAWPTSSA